MGCASSSDSDAEKSNRDTGSLQTHLSAVSVSLPTINNNNKTNSNSNVLQATNVEIKIVGSSNHDGNKVKKPKL